MVRGGFGTRRRQESWASRASTSVTGRRQTKPRQTYAVGRPSRSGRSASSGSRAGPAPPPRPPSPPGLLELAARASSARRGSLDGSHDGDLDRTRPRSRVTALASSQPAKRGACRTRAPALRSAASARSAYVTVAGQLGEQAKACTAVLSPGGRGVVGRVLAAGCRAPRRRPRCRRSRPRRPSNSARTTDSQLLRPLDPHRVGGRGREPGEAQRDRGVVLQRPGRGAGRSRRARSGAAVRPPSAPATATSAASTAADDPLRPIADDRAGLDQGRRSASRSRRPRSCRPGRAGRGAHARPASCDPNREPSARDRRRCGAAGWTGRARRSPPRSPSRPRPPTRPSSGPSTSINWSGDQA